MGNNCRGKKSTQIDLPDEKDTNQYKKLTENQIVILLSNTNYNLEEIQQWHSEFVTDCPGGTLNKQKFHEQYKRFCPSKYSVSFCDHVFRVFDADHNGFIDFQEFLLAISITSTNWNLKKKLELIFSLYDIDKNGSIDRDEFKIIIESVYKILDPKKKTKTPEFEQEMEVLFKKIDADNNQKISLNEFIDACTKSTYLLNLLAPNI